LQTAERAVELARARMQDAAEAKNYRGQLEPPGVAAGDDVEIAKRAVTEAETQLARIGLAAAHRSQPCRSMIACVKWLTPEKRLPRYFD
jgi:hypothetical protein